jgi:hypothetical protein
MYPFSFVVILQEDEQEFVRETGMGFARNFADAAHLLEEYYGEDIISIKNLELYEDAPLLFLPDDVIQKYRDDKFECTHPCDVNGNITSK